MGLVHVSEERIELFVPRPSPPRSSRPGESLVWAIDEVALPRQLLPRDCPRVYAGRTPHTSADDARRLLGDDREVIWIEPRWVDRCRRTTLYVHHLPADGFVLEDGPAGYHVAPQVVRPDRVEVVDNPLAALEGRGVDVRLEPDLRARAARVQASTLDFSIIRLHLATDRR